MQPRICFVVNSVSKTSVPATIATALVDYEDLDVELLAWFSDGSFAGEDRVDVTCLDAPRTATGMTRQTYHRARSRLQQYDVIQANQTHSGSLAKVIGKQLGIPLVSREGNIRDGFTRKGRVANGLTNALADRVVPNSRAVYESFRQWERLLVDDDDVTIIPNGVDLDRVDAAVETGSDIRDRFGIASDTIVVGTASVIDEQKAPDTLVCGLASANNRTDRRIELVVIGDGPLRSDVERLASELGVSEHLHVTGIVDRDTVYRMLGDIDIYAMPSRWEGFSNAAVEALGAGNPCVFSDIDSFLYPYRNVALFHRLNDATALGDKLARLAENPDLREFYGQLGRELVEDTYTLETVAAKYANLYRELLS